MKMRSRRALPIFACNKETDAGRLRAGLPGRPPNVLPQETHESLKVPVMQRTVLRNVHIVVRQRNEPVVLRELGFMQDACGPLVRSILTATDTLAATQLDSATSIAALMKRDATTIPGEGVHRSETGRQSETPAAPHRSRPGIDAFRARHVPTELARAPMLVHSRTGKRSHR